MIKDSTYTYDPLNITIPEYFGKNPPNVHSQIYLSGI